MRVGLNSGEVVVRAIGNDLHMDYSAVGQTTHLAARMEQLATPGSILLTAATLRLVEGLVQVNALGPVPVKGMAEPVEVFELPGPVRSAGASGSGRAGADALCGAADGAGGLQPGPGAGWGGPGPGGGAGRRGGRGQVPPGVRVRALASYAGLAGAGERLGVLRQGDALFPGD